MFNNKKIKQLEISVNSLADSIKKLEKAVYTSPTTATEIMLGFNLYRPKTDFMGNQIEALGNEVDKLNKFISQQGYKWEEINEQKWVKPTNKKEKK